MHEEKKARESLLFCVIHYTSSIGKEDENYEASESAVLSKQCYGTPQGRHKEVAPLYDLIWLS